MHNFSFKNFGFMPFMNEMRAIIKPKLPYLYSKLPEACALFGCSHISGYIKLSLVQLKFAAILTVAKSGVFCISFLSFKHTYIKLATKHRNKNRILMYAQGSHTNYVLI